jgi:hypothetical protein
VAVTSDPSAPVALWNSLIADHVVRWPPIVGRRTVSELSAGGGALGRAASLVGVDRRTLPLWPYTQVRHARSLLRLVADDAEIAEPPPLLTQYSRGAAYAERPSSDRRYVDDNAWVALAQWQERVITAPHAATSERAERQLRWLADQVDGDGGARWIEGGSSRHACSTGGVGLALALMPRGVIPGHAPAMNDELPTRCASFLHTVLADDHGMIRDNIDADGRIEATRWSYNQGLAVRLDVALHTRGHGDAIARANTAAAAGLAFFDQDELWRQPVIFNAIWFRAVLALSAVDPTGGAAKAGRASLAAYADRLGQWVATHEPFSAGVVAPDGPGRYQDGESGVIDRAGTVQVLCLASLAPDQHHLVI